MSAHQTTEGVGILFDCTNRKVDMANQSDVVLFNIVSPTHVYYYHSNELHCYMLLTRTNLHSTIHVSAHMCNMT